MKRVFKAYAFAAAVLLAVFPCGAQSLPDTLAAPAQEAGPVVVSAADLLEKADSLRKAYDFAAALEVYRKAVAAAPDSELIRILSA